MIIIIYSSQHSQNSNKLKKKKLRNKMEGNRRYKTATTKLKQVKRQKKSS